MTNGADVLAFLIPTGGWTMVGHEYEGIDFLDCEPITKAQFQAGFAKYENHKANQEKTKAAEKAALLAKLGITEDEVRLLIG
jgi:hypothetical protein